MIIILNYKNFRIIFILIFGIILLFMTFFCIIILFRPKFNSKLSVKKLILANIKNIQEIVSHKSYFNNIFYKIKIAYFFI